MVCQGVLFCYLYFCIKGILVIQAAVCNPHAYQLILILLQDSLPSRLQFRQVKSKNLSP